MPAETKVDPFKPKQPQIPGVPANPAETRPQGPRRPSAQPPGVTASASQLALWPPSVWPVWLRIGLAAGVVVVILGLAWRARVSSANRPAPPPPAPVAAAPPPAAKLVVTLPKGPGEIGTSRELAKPWSSKQFLFYNALTRETLPALAVRLPGGSLWGISLQEPYGTCKLDYVTNLGTLLSQYDFRATHPMVVNPCSGSVYDLAEYTAGSSGLVRGQVVRGTAIRAPFAIEVVERGKNIFALRME